MPTAMNISKLKRRESDTDVSSYYSEYDCTGSLGIKLENIQRMQASASIFHHPTQSIKVSRGRDL